MFTIMVLSGVAALIINIIVLVKFFQLCSDVRTLNKELSEIKAISATSLSEDGRYFYMKKRLFDILLQENTYLSNNTNEMLQERIEKIIESQYNKEITNVIDIFGFSEKYSTDDFKKELFDVYKINL